MCHAVNNFNFLRLVFLFSSNDKQGGKGNFFRKFAAEEERVAHRFLRCVYSFFLGPKLNASAVHFFLRRLKVSFSFFFVKTQCWAKSHALCLFRPVCCAVFLWSMAGQKSRSSQAGFNCCWLWWSWSSSTRGMRGCWKMLKNVFKNWERSVDPVWICDGKCDFLSVCPSVSQLASDDDLEVIGQHIPALLLREKKKWSYSPCSFICRSAVKVGFQGALSTNMVAQSDIMQPKKFPILRRQWWFSGASFSSASWNWTGEAGGGVPRCLVSWTVHLDSRRPNFNSGATGNGTTVADTKPKVSPACSTTYRSRARWNASQFERSSPGKLRFSYLVARSSHLLHMATVDVVRFLAVRES